jgi:hypothetical protein
MFGAWRVSALRVIRSNFAVDGSRMLGIYLAELIVIYGHRLSVAMTLPNLVQAWTRQLKVRPILHPGFSVKEIACLLGFTHASQTRMAPTHNLALSSAFRIV